MNIKNSTKKTSKIIKTILEMQNIIYNNNNLKILL